MYCKNCGQTLAQDQNFCPNCGTMNDASANANQQNFNQNANQNNYADQSYNTQYNNQQYANQQYNNQQYGNAQYNNQQYANAQYNNQPYLGGKDKIAIALLAFFLGGFGVHNFVLGETKKGIIKIVLSWTGISGILALIDFVKILTDSYEVNPDKYF